MRSTPVMLVLMLIWVLAVIGGAMALHVSATSTWIAVLGLAIVPPILAMRFLRPPSTTTSDDIRKALR